MADHTRAKNICYVTLNIQHGLVREHIRSGGRAVVLESGINGEMITIYDKGAHIPLLWTHLIPATLEGKATHNVQNAMFAAAMAFSLDKTLDEIRHGLRTFDTSFFQAPGRMNVFDEHAFRVILDYGHNAASIEQMSQLASKLEVAGKRIVVLAGPGDRRDEDLENIGHAAAGHFDLYICKADDDRRGRAPDETPQMIAAALRESGVPDTAIQVIADEQEAINAALDAAEPDDLVIIFGDAITRCWKQITKYNREGDDLAIRQTEVRSAEPKVTPMMQSDEQNPFVLDAGMKLVTDERGVRLVETLDEESD